MKPVSQEDQWNNNDNYLSQKIQTFSISVTKIMDRETNKYAEKDALFIVIDDDDDDDDDCVCVCGWSYSKFMLYISEYIYVFT